MRAGATGEHACRASRSETRSKVDPSASRPLAIRILATIAEAHDGRVVPDNPLSSIQCGFTLS